ncbi:MAG: deoxyhypusine synthase [Nitrospinaceae bacterium]|nr:deoxyhypusine synthase [Nitrospinaceae bacterium]NIR53515.1 deoxyhypusine synthase [Nitrospinaceae bacterium]NIS83914.1 deoxyhypusine synthase [Nitrospinaceae bacterium]NIT80722.1 deoxyhypusine synthase [Nitrospinaceae bacterium]NIU43031.1 deoxyhypusine synthase [Nitrospinaceae bacterium]
MSYKDFLKSLHPLNPQEKKQKKSLLKNRIDQVDFEKIKNVADLVDAYQGASIQARNVGLCADIFERMLKDKERPTIMLGLAGPLIAAGLRKVIRDLIHYNMVDVVVSTGAILYQDFYAALGAGHFTGSPHADDARLRDLLINRIYDTYVDEEKFAQFDSMIGQFADSLPARKYSSREFLHRLSKVIDDKDSILVTARKKGVPIFCPALNDSSIGIGLTEHYVVARNEGRQPITIDSIRDNYEITQLVVKSKRTAAFYVAGGVPKNYINDSIVMSYVFGRNTGGHKYAIQMTTDAPHWGGLSGSTLAEAQSWGKVNKAANFSMAFVEPSVSLPLVFGSAFQKKAHKGRSRLSIKWSGDQLKEFKVKK